MNSMEHERGLTMKHVFNIAVVVESDTSHDPEEIRQALAREFSSWFDDLWSEYHGVLLKVKVASVYDS